jgi:hypothetical protein
LSSCLRISLIWVQFVGMKRSISQLVLSLPSCTYGSTTTRHWGRTSYWVKAKLMCVLSRYPLPIAHASTQIWRHIQPESVSGADVSAELQGSGLVRVRLEFDPNAHPGNGTGASTPRAETGRTMSLASPSRFSLRGRRPGTADSDE